MRCQETTILRTNKGGNQGQGHRGKRGVGAGRNECQETALGGEEMWIRLWASVAVLLVVAVLASVGFGDPLPAGGSPVPAGVVAQAAKPPVTLRFLTITDDAQTAA